MIEFAVVVAILLSSNNQSVLGLPPFLPKPYGSATIDYSAINEYYYAHYQHREDADRYFPSDKQQEPIYNAREGIIIPDGSDTIDASLSTCGFQLVQAPSKVQDWNDKAQLRQLYLKELRSILVRELGGKDNNNIQYLEFYHPMLRGEDLAMTTTNTNTTTFTGAAGSPETTPNVLPTSPTASMAHIDNDFGAFEAERIIGLVENNGIQQQYANNVTSSFPRQALLEAIRQGHRFLIINCWRNAGEVPIRRAPLGIYATHYKESKACFPTSQPDGDHSRWYIFPEMTTEECLLFKQYDRDARFVSDLWHCALHDLSTTDGDDKNAPLRRSLDIRAFVVLKERVPETYDRYSKDRARPVLTYQESERFCRAQGVARQEQSRE